jgi:hypothetical protein
MTPDRTSGRKEKGAKRMFPTTNLEMFSEIPVANYVAALSWYERLLGEVPAFFPNDKEAVWKLAEHRFAHIVQQPEHAGHARHTLFIDDLDALVERLAHQGIDPVERETYANGVCKVTYRDPDGNEINFSSVPL